MFKKLSIAFIMVLFALSVIFPGVAASEEIDVRGYFSLGGTTVDLDGLNSTFQNKGYTEFSEGLFTIGGGALVKVSPKLLVGAEGQILVGEQTESAIGTKSYASSLLGGTGFLNLGYLALESERLDIIPILGLGIGGVNVKIGQSSFDDILNDPQRAASLGTISLLLNVALQADYKIKLPDDVANNSFLSIGLRGGYMFSAVDSGWFMDEFTLSDDPDGGISGPYFRITIGGGGTVNK